MVFLFLTVSMFPVLAYTQFRLKLLIQDRPVTHLGEDVYAAGNFNGWEPADSSSRFTRIDGKLLLSIEGLNANKYEFKITRGDWAKVEVDASGEDIMNRYLQLNSDTTILIDVQAWKDDFPQKSKLHSASANVHLLDSAFYMPQLQRNRKIWVYLPPGYSKSGKKYPVIYMHDGQNLFDAFSSYNGEWGIDESLDSLSITNKPGAIVVGIENSKHRINEYMPFNDTEYGASEGEQYLSFLVETLKPFVDKNYRTIRSKEGTIIAGSSLGALISYYAILRYPEVFGKCGVFSPSFWISPSMGKITDSLSVKMNGQFFFYSGELENILMKKDIRDIADRLGSNSSSLIYFVTDPAGKHNESFWKKWFVEFYLWISGNGLSYQVKTSD